MREYRRDVARFLTGERAQYPAMPLGYFNDEATALAEAFRARALADRRGELIAEFPENRARSRASTTRGVAAALGIYEKWIAYLSARKAERRAVALPAVRLRRTWRDWPAGLRRTVDGSAP